MNLIRKNFKLIKNNNYFWFLILGLIAIAVITAFLFLFWYCWSLHVENATLLKEMSSLKSQNASLAQSLVVCQQCNELTCNNVLVLMEKILKNCAQQDNQLFIKKMIDKSPVWVHLLPLITGIIYYIYQRGA